MSRLPRLSIKGKGSKVKPQPQAETRFDESGSSATAGGAHGGTTPQFAAGGTGMSSPGSQASGTFMASPGSPPPLLTSQELLSPDSTDSASETSLSKTEMKKLADKKKKADKEAEKKAEEKRKADKKEAERRAEEKRKSEKREAERRAEEKRKADKKEAEERRLEAERLKKGKKRKEEESKKSKGKKSDPKSPQDESSSYSEDSSTLVPWSTAIPGAAADLPLRELAVKSEHEAGHCGETVSEATASVHEPQQRKMLISSDEARSAESEKIRQLAATLQNVKRTEEEDRRRLELELQQKEQELRGFLLQKDNEWQEREEEFLSKLKEKDTECAELMQAKLQKYQDALDQQQKASQETLQQKANELERLKIQLQKKEQERAVAATQAKVVVQQEGELQKLKEKLREQTEALLLNQKQEGDLQKLRKQLKEMSEQLDLKRAQELALQKQVEERKHTQDDELQSLRKQLKEKDDQLDSMERQHGESVKNLTSLISKKERDVKVSEQKAVRSLESELQSVKEELKRQTELLVLEMESCQTTKQKLEQSEQHSKELEVQLKDKHAWEMKQKNEQQQLLIEQMKKDHQTELEKAQQQKQELQEALQQKEREKIANLEAAQVQHANELKAKDARISQLEAERHRREREVLDKRRKDREVLQQKGGESQGKIAELEAAQAQLAEELEGKEVKILQLKAEGKRRHEEVLDESKKERELQMRIQEMEKQHREELKGKNKQFQKAIDEMHKAQENTLEMQKARIERKVEREQAKKHQEAIERARAELRQEIQTAADKSKAELLQRKEMEFQAAMQQRDRESEAREAELKDHHTQELVNKDLKIHELESAQFIPSSEPPDEVPRRAVQSQEAHMDDLPSNVIDLAREISHFVDPENIIPEGKLTRELSPNELLHVMQAMGSPALLGAQKPQSFLFAVLPATNKMSSTLFDYTGCFREAEEEQPVSLPYRTPEGSPQISLQGSVHGNSFQEVQSTSEMKQLSLPGAALSLEASTCYLPQRQGQTYPPPGEHQADAAVNLPDSVKVERLQKTINSYQRLQADKEQELQDKTNEVKKLSEAVAKREQHIEDLEAQIESLSERVKDLSGKVDDQSRKVEERDRQIDALKKGGKASALNQKSEEEFDEYFEQVVKLTAQVTEYEAELKKQKREVTRLKELESRINEFEQQVFQAGSQLSEKEEEIKSKDDQIRRLHHDLRGGTADEQVQALEDEIDWLRPFETEITKLKEELRKAQQGQFQVVQLQSESKQLKPLRDECAQLKTELEASQRDIILLRTELARKEARQSRIEAEEMQKQHHTVVEGLDQGSDNVVRPSRPGMEPSRRQVHVQLLQTKIKDLEEKLQSRDEDIKQLREEKYPSLRYDPATLEALRSGSEDAAAIEIAELREVLEQKERKIHNLEQQVKSVEGIIRDRNLLHGHSKEQSRAVFRLQQQLETTESQKRNLEEVQYGEAVAKLEQTREELKQVKEERDSALAELQQLQQDLITAENESNKELKTAKSTAKLQLETEKARTEQLQLEIQGWEANVKRLEAELDLLKADKEAVVAETIVDSEEGIAALQRALSDVESERQALYRDYIEEKQSHERAQQECMELGIKLSNVQLEVDRMKTQALGWKETMEGQGGTVATLRDNMERLVKENHDLKEEIEARKQQSKLAKEDFEAERHDREQAARHYDDEKARMNLVYQRLDGELKQCYKDIDMYKGEIDRLKEELARNGELGPKFEAIQMELVAHREQEDAHKAQQIAMKKELEESHQKLEENITSTAKLHDEVLAKTQQVKQYKKQVDGYKGQVKEMKAEMDGLKTELGVYQQQLTGAQQMAADMDTLRQQRDSLASQLQLLKGRKSSESEFATAFQSEFDKRNELERKNTEVREHCEWLYQENERLKAILQQHSIACPDQLQHPARARIVPAGPVMPRSPGDQQRPLGHATPQQTVRPPPHSGPPQHQLQYPEQQYSQQGHLYQPPTSAVQTATPQHQVGLQQRPVPGPQHQLQYPEQQYAQQEHLYQPPTSAVQTATPQHLQQRPVPGPSQQPINVAAVRHQQAHSVAQQQEVEQRALAYAQEKERAFALQQQQQQLEQQRQREQLQQQQLLEQEQQALAQSAALKQAQERRMQQQMQQQQQTEAYRKQKGAPLKAQMKAYSVDDPRYAHGQPRGGVPQPQVHEGSQVPRSNQSTVPSTGPNAQGNRLLPNRAQMEPNTLRPQNGSQQNFAPHNYQVPQHQGYPPPQGDYDPHHQHSSLPSSIKSIGVRHTADQALHMQDGNNLSASTLAGQPGQRPRSGFVHSHADQQYLRQGVATNAAPNQFQSPHDHSPIVRAHIAPPSQQPPRERKPQQPNAAFPRSNESPFSQTPAVSQAPRGHVREIQAGAPIVVPMQATNADIDAQERVSVPTQESNPDLPQQQAGLKQSAQDPKESLDKELMKGLQGDIRGAAEGVKAATERESSASAADGTIPLDPNLICPYCNKNFRIGEIQIFRRHVSSCTGT